MGIFRFKKGKKNPYFLAHTSTINDSRLSNRAKGLLCYLISKPDNWYVNYKDLVNSSQDGITAVRSTIRELIETGYLVRSQLRQDNGRFGFYDFTIYEKPQIPKCNKINTPPHCLKPHTVRPHTFKPTLYNTDKKDITKKDNTTTTSVVLPENVADDSLILNEKKYKASVLLVYLRIKNQNKLFDKFSIDDILKYCDWMDKRKKPAENPTGFLITAIKEKWLDDIVDTPENREEMIWWYKCNLCNKEFGRYYETDEVTHCSKCDIIIKAESRKVYLKNKKRSSP
ncbi:hypothetical protein LCGC14_2227850 [marine sediment metagenome]|uniref:Uncharacterized protein n=1 Tax=marine sediment metagenome TaxID=412755 RepID=A0A0F9D980_9ZZZZ